jgi:2-keto-3-deoxy-L-rhamnonate aldolase RhmA
MTELKGMLKSGLTAVGCWVSIDHPAVSTLLGGVGFDWVAFDAEHGHFTTTTLLGCLDAVSAQGISTLVRVPANDATSIKQVLDLGPEGVIVPMVSTASQAHAAAAACRFPPQGVRGMGAGRAARYGLDLADYLRDANDRVVVITQIEHIDAVKNSQEIASVDGIDALFIGPADLSASMGIPLEWDHPKFTDAIDQVLDAARRHGRPVGMWCRDREWAANMVTRGMQIVVWTSDASLLADSARKTIGDWRDEHPRT